MDMAWNMDALGFEKLPRYLERYAAREFGEEHASDVAEILMEFSHLVGLRRYEHLQPNTYSITNYHEAERVLGRWQALAARASSIHDRLDEQVKPAFYQLVYWPAASGANFCAVMIGVGFNYRYAQERRNAANALAAHILQNFDRAYDLIEEWDAMLDGKWARMMSQAVFDAIPQEPKLWTNPSRDMLANVSYV